MPSMPSTRSGSPSASPRRASPGQGCRTRSPAGAGPVAGLRGSGIQRTGLIGQRFDSLDRLGKARAGPGPRPRGTETTARYTQPGHRRPGADRPPRATSARLRRLQRQCGCRSRAVRLCRGIRRNGSARLDDDRVLARLPVPDRRILGNGYPVFSPDGELLVAVYGLVGGGNLLRVWHMGRRS